MTPRFLEQIYQYRNTREAHLKGNHRSGEILPCSTKVYNRTYLFTISSFHQSSQPSSTIPSRLRSFWTWIQNRTLLHQLVLVTCPSVQCVRWMLDDIIHSLRSSDSRNGLHISPHPFGVEIGSRGNLQCRRHWALFIIRAQAVVTRDCSGSVTVQYPSTCR